MANHVLGIDFGEDTCVIAAIGLSRGAGIQIIKNDSNERATESIVSFGEYSRIFGSEAKRQGAVNKENTIYGIKHLIGRRQSDPEVQSEKSMFPFNMIQQRDGRVGIKVDYKKGENTFIPTQIAAMLFTRLKQTAETELGAVVTDAVIGVPYHFTDIRKEAVRNAARIAGLNVLELLYETTAAALTYGVFSRDLLNTEKKPRTVVFVDAGHTALQVSVIKFENGMLKTLATSVEPQNGGLDITSMIANHFVDHIQDIYKIDVRSNPRSMMRLLAESEKVKRKMSDTAAEQAITIDNLSGIANVSVKINRAHMELMINNNLNRMKTTMKDCLKDSGIIVTNIHSVIAVGGSSRIPAVKELIKDVFQKEPSSTLNKDEAVARGCALQAASLSSHLQKHGFDIEKVQPIVPDRSDSSHSIQKLKALTENELWSMIEEEAHMVKADNDEKLRLDAKNALEEYVYGLKSRLGKAAISETYRKSLNQSLSLTENLLFKDGNQHPREEYVDILAGFKQHGEQIKEGRYQQFETPMQHGEQIKEGRYQQFETPKQHGEQIKERRYQQFETPKDYEADKARQDSYKMDYEADKARQDSYKMEREAEECTRQEFDNKQRETEERARQKFDNEQRKAEDPTNREKEEKEGNKEKKTKRFWFW